MVTLFTDASWCPETRLGGWAAWWKYDGVMNRKAGIFRHPPFTSGHAELRAAINGVWLIKETVPCKSNLRVLLQTDCLEVIEVMKNPLATSWLPVRADVDLLNSMLKSWDFRLITRHVKAHRGRGDRETKEGKRMAVNWWCDQAAREQLAAARKLRETLK